MLLTLCLISQIVSAASLTVTMKPSSSSVKEATEFTVKVSVSNLDVGDNGINSLTGYLKYDDQIFESIDEASVEGLNKWKATYDEATGKIELTKSTFVKTSQEVFQIVFKTKTGTSGKSGSIEFSDINASNSEEKISASDISVSISVTEKGDDNTSDNSITNTKTISIGGNTENNTANNTSNKVSNNTSNNVTTNNATNNTSNNATNNTSNYTNTTSEDNMPKTGVSDTLVSLMLGFIVVALVFYIKIEKINKDIQ